MTPFPSEHATLCRARAGKNGPFAAELRFSGRCAALSCLRRVALHRPLKRPVSATDAPEPAGVLPGGGAACSAENPLRPETRGPAGTLLRARHLCAALAPRDTGGAPALMKREFPQKKPPSHHAARLFAPFSGMMRTLTAPARRHDRLAPAGREAPGTARPLTGAAQRRGVRNTACPLSSFRGSSPHELPRGLLLKELSPLRAERIRRSLRALSGMPSPRLLFSAGGFVPAAAPTSSSAYSEASMAAPVFQPGT